MTDPFASSRQKFARAEKHFTELQTQISLFHDIHPYERVTEPHPDRPINTVQKVRMTQHIPPSINDEVAETAVSLRSALDNAVYSVALAAGIQEPRNAAFPFAASAAHMVNAIGRCKDVPKEIQSLFCGFQPYKGGNDLLWALNEVANTDKHKITIPVGQAVTRYGVNVHGTGWVSMPEPHVWDRTKNEMVLIELGPGATCSYDFQFVFFVAFHDIEFIDGKDVLRVLHNFGTIVDRILLGIEAECRRLGIIKP